MKILVLGATGFVGSYILKELMKNNEEDIVVGVRNPNKLPDDYNGEIRVGDINDAKYRKTVLKEIDVVCNTIAWSSLWGNRKSEYDKFYIPTLELMKEAIHQKIKKFLHTSTVVVAKFDKDINPNTITKKAGFWPYLDYLVQLEEFIKSNSDITTFISMRLGHFIGKGNKMGFAPLMQARLKTHLVPLLGNGEAIIPLISPEDIASAYYLTIMSENLIGYTPINFTGKENPTLKDVITFISEESKVPKWHFRAPYRIGWGFAWLMEKISYLHPGSPFLTRSIIRLANNWDIDNSDAKQLVGYNPVSDWKEAISAQLNWINNQEGMKYQ